MPKIYNYFIMNTITHNNRGTFSVSFFARKTQYSSVATVYVRITINRASKDLSTHQKIPLDKWDVRRYCYKGNSETARTINHHLDIIKSRLFLIHTDLIAQGKPVTLSAVVDEYLGLGKRKYTVIGTIDFHNKQKIPTVSKATLERYETMKMHIQNFMRTHYGKEDIYLYDLNMEFVRSFEGYLRFVRGCNHNSTMKYIKNFRTVILMAVENEWLRKDPFSAYKVTLQKVEITPLTLEELERIEKKKFTSDRLSRVRDVFVFCCYTGYSYSDVAKLAPENVLPDEQGNLWIRSSRIKTKIQEDVPLLPQAKQLIDKYKSDPECLYRNRLLPVLSNQKYNAYLKEIAVLCNISINLTTHVARHTYATRCLTLGVPIETVSKTMGHTNTRMTSHYAKITEAKILNEMYPLMR